MQTGPPSQAPAPAPAQPSVVGHNRLCNLGDFADPDVLRAIREAFPHEIERYGSSYPQGVEYRKHWEVAMAVRALESGGAVHPNATILGVGAGNEPTIFHLTNKVHRVFATDLYLTNDGWEDSANASMLSDPGRHWPATTPWNPRHLVVQHMNALNLLYEDETFDGVFSSSSIEHFGTANEVNTSLGEIYRVLKPGGILSISTEFRVAGPAPGLPGVLMFDEAEMRSLFLDPFDWEPIDPLDFGLSNASLATEQRLVDLSAEVSEHVRPRGFIQFHDLYWNHYPHIVLRHDDLVWTSVHLALRKPAPDIVAHRASVVDRVASMTSATELAKRARLTSRGLVRRGLQKLGLERVRRPHGEPVASPPVDTVPTTAPLPPQLARAGSRRSSPLPDGWTYDGVRGLLGTISIDAAPPEEIAAYLNEDYERFLLTWSLVADATGKALEIGSNPYFTSVLLREFTGLELTMTNSFDPAATGVRSQRVAYRGADQAGVHEHEFVYHSLNVEAHDFPFRNDEFDVVVFCEVLEHLLSDPIRALSEINRVLKPGGRLVVSTPNVARLENVARLAAGANIYDPYSGYGPYGRHNREYTRHELVKLVEFAGFAVTDHFTVDVHEHGTGNFVPPESLLPLVGNRLEDLGQYLFVSARSASQPTAGRPMEIYRSLPLDIPLQGW